MYIPSSFLWSKKITIKISGNYTEDEKKRLENAIHSHYRQKNNYLNKIDRYDDVYRLFFILMGTLLIFISYNCKTFASELFLIAGWVAISEIVYDLLFKTINRKRENVALKKLLKCKIIFED